MIRIYASGPCPRYQLISQYMKHFKLRHSELDIEVISTWHEDPRTNDNYSRGAVYLQECAERDSRQVQEADIFLQFNMEGSGGGMWSELGFAYALGTRCVIVGKKRTGLFHFLQGVILIPKLEDLVKVIECEEAINNSVG